MLCGCAGGVPALPPLAAAPGAILPRVGKLVLAAVLAIALLTAGSLLLIYRLTESAEARPVAARPAAAPAPPDEPPPPMDLPPLPAPLEAGPGAPIVIPARPVAGGPVWNESPPIQGPEPMPLPEDPAERREALDQVRKNKLAEQVERLNRRNQERAAQGAPPPAPGPAPGTENR